jgi:hypothetical protein
MKNLKQILFTVALALAAFTTNAQVKIGKEPTNVTTNTNLEVQANNGVAATPLGHVVVTKDLGKVGVGITAPSAMVDIHGTLTWGNSTGVSGAGSFVKLLSNSAAGGTDVLVNADNALGVGLTNTVTGNAAIVGGKQNNVSASGTNALVLGDNNNLSGTSSAVGGSTNVVSGVNSIVFGFNNKDNAGHYSSMVGYNNTLTGSATSVSGNDHTISAAASLVTGGNNTVDGIQTIVGGGTNNVSAAATASLTVGTNNTVTGRLSIVGGTVNTNSGVGSLVIGRLNNLSGDYSSIIAGNGITGSAFNTAYANALLTTSGGVGTISDRRLKKNIADLHYGLTEILALSPKSYTYKRDETQRTNFGFIAQDVKSIMPELVINPGVSFAGDNTKDYIGLSYQDITAVLVKGMQEQQMQIDAIKAENTKLKAQMKLITKSN